MKLPYAGVFLRYYKLLYKNHACDKRFPLSGLKKYLKAGQLIVEDKQFRKHGFMNKGLSAGEIPYMFSTVAVAGEKYGKIIFAAATQDLQTVGSGVTPVSIRGKGGFVDLEDGSAVSGSSGKDIVIQRKMRIVTMPQDLDAGIFHGVDKSGCIFFAGAASVGAGMHTDNGIIQLLKNILLQIDTSGWIQYIKLSSVKKFKIEPLSGRKSKAAEI